MYQKEISSATQKIKKKSLVLNFFDRLNREFHNYIHVVICDDNLALSAIRNVL